VPIPHGARGNGLFPAPGLKITVSRATIAVNLR